MGKNKTDKNFQTGYDQGVIWMWTTKLLRGPDKVNKE